MRFDENECHFRNSMTESECWLKKINCILKYKIAICFNSSDVDDERQSTHANINNERERVGKENETYGTCSIEILC